MENELEFFRLKWRVALMERLVYRTELSANALVHQIPIRNSAQALKDWLDVNSSVADKAYGEHFHDPAMAARYADEVKETVEKMKEIVDEVAADMKRDFEKHDRGA
jgi:hypothetical protein